MGNAAVAEEKPAVETEEQGLPNKCKYPEFAGFTGEDYLKDILRKILPLAIFRTWDILLAKQSYGNDMYLSMPILAAKAGRSLRTVRRHLTDLREKHLMIERLEQKMLLSPDGSLRTRTVVVKDCSGLYDLAHEYHLWTLSDTYIEPDRDLIKAILMNEHLVAKLRRFENYRKLMYQEPPGPRPQDRDEYHWFTEHVEDAQETSVEKTNSDRTKYLPEKPSKEVAEMSQKRINENDQLNDSERGSFDSEAPLEKGGEASANLQICSQDQGSVAADYTKETKEINQGKTDKIRDTQPNPTNPSPSQKGRLALPASNKRESVENDQNVRLAHQAMAAAGFGVGRAASQANDRPPKNALAR